MAYRVLIRRSAEKEAEALPGKVRDTIFQKIRALAQEPRPRGCKKLSGEDRAWRMRVGDYRIVYEINDTDGYVDIRLIAHRKDVYR